MGKKKAKDVVATSPVFDLTPDAITAADVFELSYARGARLTQLESTRAAATTLKPFMLRKKLELYRRAFPDAPAPSVAFDTVHLYFPNIEQTVAVPATTTCARVKEILQERMSALSAAAGPSGDGSSGGSVLISIGGVLVNHRNEVLELASMPSVARDASAGNAIVVTLTDERQQDLERRIKLINVKIGALIGQPILLHTLQRGSEKDVFRARMAPVIEQEIRSRKEGVYVLAPDVSLAPLPRSMSERLAHPVVVRFHFMNTSESKGLEWNLLDTPAAILARIFATSRKVVSQFVPDDAVPEAYVLKAYGSADFYVGDTILANFCSIRKALMRHAQIHVSILSRVDAISQAKDDVDEEDLLEKPPVGFAADHTHEDLTVDRVAYDLEEVQRVSAWDCRGTPLRIRIAGIEGLCLDPAGAATEKKGHHKKDKAPKRAALESGHLFVSARLYHGSVQLGEAKRTAPAALEANPRWGEVLTFDLDLADVPKAARICITVFGSPAEAAEAAAAAEAIPIGWINCTVFDFASELRQGPLALAIWPFAEANPIATLATNPDPAAGILHLRFSEYAVPVHFPVSGVTAAPLVTRHHATTLIEADVVNTIEDDGVALAKIVSRDAVYRLTSADKQLLWRNRELVRMRHPRGLAKLILAVPYNLHAEVAKLHDLLALWPPYEAPLDALELLDAEMQDSKVRQFAVDNLWRVSDDELNDLMIQLVQAVKNENRHDNPLARFLLLRSLRSRRLGHVFFWNLKAEMHVPTVAERFGLYLESYLRGCGKHRDELVRQVRLTSQLTEAAVFIKTTAAPSVEALQAQLGRIQLDTKVALVHNQSVEVRGLIINKCKYMESKKVPLWLVFSNADGEGGNCLTIFKEGDDIRQDMLTLQMIRIMDKIWQNDDMDLRLKPYVAIATGDETGYIEVVPNANTLANIQMEKGGISGAFKSTPLAEYLREHNPTDAEYAEAVENFLVSCAGYCVATFVLGIGDRHNDNIMLDKTGHLFHIDFGHFLGNIKKKFGVNRERTPFVFTPDMVYVMGGKESEAFARFLDICVRAYNILRRHSNLFINLFAMMLSTGIPELQTVEDIQYLRNVLQLDATEEEAGNYFRDLVDLTMKRGWTTQLNWWVHNLVHSSSFLKKKI